MTPGDLAGAAAGRAADAARAGAPARGMTLGEAARVAQARVVGRADVVFRRVAPVRDAGADDLAYLARRRYASDLPACEGAALLVAEELADVAGGPADRLVVSNPRAALARLLGALHPEPAPAPGVHPTAVVDASVDVPASAAIDAHAVIGADVRLGRDVRIGAGCWIGAGSRVGAGSTLHPNATLYPGVRLGRRVVVHAGARIGVDGFGFAAAGEESLRIPQVGGCVIEDDVEIGANCTIDRGSIGCTAVGKGAKLDDAVHLGHNVVVGAGSMLAAQVGVAGSTRIGAGVVVGGQAGLADHLTVGDGARVGAQAGVIGDVPAGRTVSGYPARDHGLYLRAMARLMRLPEAFARLRALERRAGSEAG